MEDATFEWPEGKRAAVSLSFDDARLSQVDRGLELLGRFGVKATFYVSADRLAERLAGWRAAVTAGHEIANHTRTHPCSGNFAFARRKAVEDWTPERMEQDILAASAEIEGLLGVKCETFAYPCGQTYVGRGEGVRSYVPIVARHFLAGRGAFSETHNAPAFCDLAQLFSRDADGRTWGELRQMVDAAILDGGWLILTTHEIGDGTGRRQVTDADALAALCRFCTNADHGVWLGTVAAVARYVRDRRAGCEEAQG